MARQAVEGDAGVPDEVYQDRILRHVSRTFALTIPELPPRLRSAVTSAYLACRIADTIEDEPALSAGETERFLERFAAVTGGKEDARRLACELAPRLSGRSLPAEHDLVRSMERVIRMIARLDEVQRGAIQRCIEVMCRGMHQFQRDATVRGLRCSSDLDSYCYYVAGVVGEMLTELMCAYSPAVARRRGALHELAASFGQGLQMTNILKDIWEDRARGACWLPRDVFNRHGVELADLTPEGAGEGFHAGLRELIGVAHGHLRNAHAFTLLIPAREAGIRRFCLWAIGLALLTLRRINAHPQFTAGAEVKVSHSAVTLIRALTSAAVRSDWMLTRLFARAATGLPLGVPAVTIGAGGARAGAAAAPRVSLTDHERRAPSASRESIERRADGSARR